MSIKNPQGYLININDWTKEIALEVAREENLLLTDAHWEIISFLQKLYQLTQDIPPQRLFIKALAKELGSEKIDSLYFHKLFPEGLKQACKIAGLPKPRHCL